MLGSCRSLQSGGNSTRYPQRHNLTAVKHTAVHATKPPELIEIMHNLLRRAWTDTCLLHIIYIHTHTHTHIYIYIQGEAIPVTRPGGPLGSETSRLSHSLDSRLTDYGEVSLTRWLPFTPSKIHGTHFFQKAESTPGPKCGREELLFGNLT
jgi:hypothetical protein